ncbi:MAG: hypothetical protein PHU99_05045 [Candidatus Cloacimonetes bacterium]|jgi:hypothetical protein|nr:hypothetical protein [Candidatus Cloacimonadota bacterium]MDY0337293.1 hypothetical protein [Candidatus Cloacimonadaceae bacterium]MCB5268842.1 hypothetical protein [Candidatus Cloacimonadota bacterium]MCK9334962.1 hypothetical protein [Candidatus Cloacimonadota bacterium]MDD2542893.1 hypothetical protein [Candidatus Cloacimonadota bacterium]
MSDTKNNTITKTSTNTGLADKNKVSLVELIMILLLVGLIFVFVFGMRQLKIDKAAEALAQTKFETLIPTLQEAIAAAEEFKKTDDFGEYPFDISQMNLGDITMDDFVLEYDGENYAFVATTKESFGKAGIKVTYVLADRSYSVEDPAPERKPTIRDEWLPQE